MITEFLNKTCTACAILAILYETFFKVIHNDCIALTIAGCYSYTKLRMCER